MEREIINIYNSENSIRVENDNRTVSYVPGDYFFRNMTTNFGHNTSSLYPNSCGYVAIGILLSYYDAFYNDNIINDYYDKESVEDFYYYSDINTEDYDTSPGIDDDFHYYLINLGRGMGFTASDKYNIDWTEIDDFIEEYFDDLDMSVTVNTADVLYPNKTQYIKDAIDDGYPVIVGIYGIDNDVSSSYLDHSVVAYGYNGNDIKAHYGWHNYSNLYEYTINNYWYAIAHYIEFNDCHVDSDNYEWSVGGTICPCGEITAIHRSLSCSYFNSLKHHHYCSNCGYGYFETHNYVQQGNQYVCSGCGNVVNSCPHNESYDWVDFTQHRVTCNMCSLNYLEPHVVSANAFQNGQQYAECLLCLGIATFGIVGLRGLNNIYRVLE